MKMDKKQKYFLSLYEPVHDHFERFCRARVYGNMEYQDLLNETLLVAYQKIDTLKTETSFLSFLIGISIRLLANNNKKLKEESISDESYSNVIDINSNTDQSAEVSLLYKALSILPDQQRECIILFEISGFSIKEIMKIQEASESAIKQRLRRSRKRLTEILTYESDYKLEEVKNGTS